MSDYQELLQKYNELLEDTKDITKFKVKIKHLEKEIERLNRVLKMREKELIELSILVKVSKNG